jgi:hypothetical protein
MITEGNELEDPNVDLIYPGFGVNPEKTGLPGAGKDKAN